MPHRHQLFSHKMRASASLNNYGACREIAEKLHHLLAREFLVKQLSPWLAVTVQVECIFAEIDTNQC